MNLQPQRSHLGRKMKRKLHLMFKGILVGLILGGFAVYRIFLPSFHVECIYDAYQHITIAFNNNLVVDQQNSAFQGNNNQLTDSGKAFIGAGQVLMDVWVGVFGVIWLIFVKNVRGFGAIAGFFLTRGIIFLNIQKFPFPESLAWRSPGFFALTVPYDHTRDFFYSGHTGILTIIFLQMVILNFRVPATIAFLSLIFMMNMLLITRVHYVVDIAGGLIFAIWYHRTATRYVLYIDKFLTLPYFIVKWIYINKCKNYCDEEDMTDPGELQKHKQQGKKGKKDIKLNEHFKIDYHNGLIEMESKTSQRNLGS